VIAIGVVGSVGLVALHMARALVGAPYFVWLLRRARA
jgi:ABC-type Fe3+-siderophore transport system permease subunit